jgi:hypothetical protein
MDGVDTARVSDQAALIETLAQAFQTDPALSWILPDAAHRARTLRSLFRTLVPADMRAGVALRASGDEAAALWRAPGQAHSGTMEFLRTVVPLVATFRTALPRGLKVQGGIDAHRPKGASGISIMSAFGPTIRARAMADGSFARRRPSPTPKRCHAGWRRPPQRMCRCTSGWAS